MNHISVSKLLSLVCIASFFCVMQSAAPVDQLKDRLDRIDEIGDAQAACVIISRSVAEAQADLERAYMVFKEFGKHSQIARWYMQQEAKYGRCKLKHAAIHTEMTQCKDKARQLALEVRLNNIAVQRSAHFTELGKLVNTFQDSNGKVLTDVHTYRNNKLHVFKAKAALFYVQKKMKIELDVSQLQQERETLIEENKNIKAFNKFLQAEVKKFKAMSDSQQVKLVVDIRVNDQSVDTCAASSSKGSNQSTLEKPNLKIHI